MATTLHQQSPMGPTVPLDVRCACAAARRIPVRLVSDGLAELRRQVLGSLEPDVPLLTYRCRHCKQVVTLTARDLFLSE